MTDSLLRRETRVVESLLENERLTDELDDEAAQLLLDWGMAYAKAIVQSTSGLDDEAAEEAMYPRLRALRRTMRTISRWAVKQPEWDSERNADSLAKIIEQIPTIYGEGYTPPTPQQSDTFLQQQAEFAGNPTRLITNLRKWLETASSNSTDQEGV